MVVFEKKRFHSDKVVVFRQMLLYSGKSGYIWAKWMYSGKVVVFGKSGCFRVKIVVFGQKWLYVGKVIFIPAKVVVFR